MGVPSKEYNLLELFFNYPTKYWYFKELKEKLKISDNRLSIRLKFLLKDKLISRIKEKYKMPYYISNWNSPSYKNKKKLFAFETLCNSGFLDHLLLLNAKTVIIFGSFTRWDWYKDSDIDVFIYGSSSDFEIGRFEKKLKREIHVFNANNKNDLKKLGKDLLKNILEGELIKGDISFVEVNV